MDAEGDDYYNFLLLECTYTPYTAASVKLGYQQLFFFCFLGFDSVFHINYLFYLDIYVIWYCQTGVNVLEKLFT